MLYSFQPVQSAGVRLPDRRALRPLSRWKVVKRSLKVNVQVADVVSEMIKKALIEIALLVCHQGLKGLPDLQSARKALLWSHEFEGVVRGISPAHIMAYQVEGVNTQQLAHRPLCR